MFDLIELGANCLQGGAMTKDRDLVSFLRDALRSREWSQADFARNLGVSTGAVAMWMNGKRVPGPVSVERIADVLHVNTDSLLVLAGHRPPDSEFDPSSNYARMRGLIDAIDWDAHPEWMLGLVDMLEALARQQAKEDAELDAEIARERRNP